MIKEERKLNMQKVKACIIIAIAILLLIIISICAKINKNKNRYKELTILLNNQFIELTDEVVIDDNKNIFFSKDDIQNFFDATIYYNEAEKELITTYNTHVALLKVDEEYAEINDETIKLNGKLYETKNDVYMPILDLAEVYDLEINYSSKSNRIIMDSITKQKTEATVMKRNHVKTRKGIFGKKLEKVIIGDKLVVIENDGKYKKVRTALGNIGYIKEDILSAEKKIREDKKYNLKEINVYRNYSNISGIYDNIEKIDDKKLNVVVPTFFYLEKNSKVLDKTTSTTATYSVYKNWVDSNNLQILPTFSNNESVSNNLLSYSQRSSVINDLRTKVLKYNYAGINIEFNSINDVNSFYRFILELVPRFKEEGLLVAVTLNNNLDKSRLEGVVDYILEK